MVDDDEILYRIDDVRRFAEIDVVHVDDDRERAAVNHILRFDFIDKQIPVFGIPLKPFETAGEIFIVFIRYDKRLYPAEPAKPDDCDTGSKCVEIGEFMSHDQHIVGSGYQHDQLVCDHAGAHLGAFLDGFGLSAVKFHAVGGLDDHLIAAALKRHIERRLRSALLSYKLPEIVAIPMEIVTGIVVSPT